MYFDDEPSDKVRKQKRHQILYELLKGLGYEVEKNELISIIKKTSKMAEDKWYKNYKTSGAYERVLHTLNLLNINLKEVEFESAVQQIEDIGFKYPPLIKEDTKKILEELRKTFKIGLISDTGQTSGRILRKIMSKDNIIEYFDVLVFSDEVGAAKPDRFVFQTAAERLGVPLDKIIHIGDNIKTDVIGATNCEMYIIHIGKDKNGAVEYSTNNKYYYINELKEIIGVIKKIIEHSSNIDSQLVLE